MSSSSTTRSVAVPTQCGHGLQVAVRQAANPGSIEHHGVKGLMIKNFWRLPNPDEDETSSCERWRPYIHTLSGLHKTGAPRHAQFTVTLWMLLYFRSCVAMVGVRHAYSPRHARFTITLWMLPFPGSMSSSSRASHVPFQGTSAIPMSVLALQVFACSRRKGNAILQTDKYII